MVRPLAATTTDSATIDDISLIVRLVGSEAQSILVAKELFDNNRCFKMYFLPAWPCSRVCGPCQFWLGGRLFGSSCLGGIPKL